MTVPLAAAGSFRLTRPGDDAVAGVDFGRLADLDVLGLRLRNPELGLQPARIGDARQVLAGPDPLADFDRHLLEHAGEPGVTFSAARRLACRSATARA